MGTVREGLRRIEWNRTTIALILCIVAGLVQRVALLVKYSDLWFCSDEANLGLMAVRLIQEGKLYIFIPGESYGGTFGLFAIAFFAIVTGSPFIALKLIALLNFILFALLLFILGRKAFNDTVGLFAVSMVSLAPAYLAVLGSRQRGPHGEFLVLGTLLLLLTISVAETAKPTFFRFVTWGALVGLSWYVYYLSVFYIVPCFLFLAFQRAWKGGWHWFRSKDLVRAVSGMLFGFLAGSIGYWVFVLKYWTLPPFSTSRDFFDPLLGLKNFFLVGMPVLTGGPWGEPNGPTFTLLSRIVLGFYLLAVVGFIISVIRKRNPLSPMILLATFLFLYPLMYAFSSFAWFAQEPRYLTGLYIVLPLTLGWAIQRVHQRSRILSLAALLLIWGTSVYGTWNVPRYNFNVIYDEPNKEILSFLEKHEIRHFYGNYWIVYRLMFESLPNTFAPLQLMGSVLPGTGPERYPDLAQHVKDDPTAAFVVWITEAEKIEESLRVQGRLFTKTIIGRYAVFRITEPGPLS